MGAIVVSIIWIICQKIVVITRDSDSGFSHGFHRQTGMYRQGRNPGNEGVMIRLDRADIIKGVYIIDSEEMNESQVAMVVIISTPILGVMILIIETIGHVLVEITETIGTTTYTEK